MYYRATLADNEENIYHMSVLLLQQLHRDYHGQFIAFYKILLAFIGKTITQEFFQQLVEQYTDIVIKLRQV